MTEERKVLDGAVDFTMMYAAHDAFTRDLGRIVSACLRGDAATGTRAGWDMFARQLHVHHTAEDASLWPRLRAQPLQPEEVEVLDEMESEHAEIDPRLASVEEAFADGDDVELVVAVQTLRIELASHMRHEENAALPLVERYLGPAGWAEFGQEIRKTQGLRAGAAYLPWVLDDATPEMERKVLALLPPPVRILYRRLWAPRYRRSAWWDAATRSRERTG